MVTALRNWTMLDVKDQPVKSPCCGADWMEPYLLTALCAECAKAYEMEKLGVVRGVR